MSMSERCEPCQDLRSQSHIAQQSRRDKLRVQQQQQLHNSEIGASLMPLYDPSEMLTFITGNNDDRSDFQNQTIPISYKASSTTSDLILNYAGSQNPLLDGPIAIPSVLSSSPAGTIKQTNFSSSSSSSSSSSASPSSQNLFLMNPSFSYPMNPNTTNQETHKQFVEVPIPLNFNGFSQSLYSPQVPQNLSTYSSLRFSNGSFNEGVGGFKQEPLSLTQDSTGQEGLSLSLAFQNPPAELHLQQFDTRFDLTHGSDMFNVGHHHDKTAKPDDDIYNRQLIESSYCSGSYPRDGNGNGNGKGSTNNVLVPLGPFTGYATVLKSSRFLKPAQQLLDGFCNVGHAVPIQVLNKEQEMLLEGATGGHGSGSFDPTSRVSTVVESCSSSVFTSNIEGGSECAVDDPLASGGDRSENQKKKMKLMSMLDEVCRRYRHYYEQLQAVVSSFDSVAGLRSAAPYTCLALKVISRHFRCLKNAIANQLRSITKALGEDCHDKEEEIPRMRFVDRRGASPLRRSGGIIGQQNVWRPQRGLPERAVTLLRAWLFEHFLHPYPTDADKQMMAKQTGLSRSQVSNWFINARVRLWKPMVEEIHMLETRQPSSTSAMDLNNSIKKPDTLSEELNNLQNQQQKTTIEVFPGEQQQQQQNNDQPIKRSRSEHTSMIRREESINFSYENLNPLDSHAGIRIGAVGNTSSSGVSLTLGLHHNGIQEKYHNNSNNNNVFLSQTEHEVAHHFRSLQQQGNDGSEAFGFDSFVGAQQSLQLRKQIGCQSLHDFVG